jgi:hypothetical protein
MKHRHLLSAAVVALAGLSASAAIAVPSNFRVAPYLQQPGSDGVLVTWFTEANTPGTITITGGGLTSPIVRSTTPSATNVAYTTVERNLAASTTRPFNLFSDNNFKHSVDLRGLAPNQTYSYTVNQGGQTFTNTFRTAPTAANWDSIRFVAASDSETEPAGNFIRREYPLGPVATGSLPRPNIGLPATPTTPVYYLTETVGYQRNIDIMQARNPNFILMPGDLVQGAGFQPAWDEFFRHNAGAYDTFLSNTPILPALGNWENFANPNGGYGTPTNRMPVAISRERYKTYFDMPSNGTPEHQDNYYRIDYGPITIITLDSSNGEPDQTVRPGALDTDTQNNFTRADYEATTGRNDLSDFNPGSVQWNWAVNQLADARARGQLVFVQFHHTPYSVGEHAVPMGGVPGFPGLLSSGQGGTPMRVYHPLFEQFGVAAVLSGHSEIWERSFVDLDGDGVGVHYVDVGMAGDGLRGPLSSLNINDTAALRALNPFLQFLPHIDAPEFWAWATDPNGQVYARLIDGGRHYGHLEVNFVRDPSGQTMGRLELIPVYSFPIFDAFGRPTGETERRIYNDIVTLTIGQDGRPISEPATLAIFGLGLGGLTWLMRRRRAR